MSPSAADRAESTVAAVRGDAGQRLNVAAAFHDEQPGRPSHGNLVYAWSNVDRAAWVSRRYVAATRVVARVTPAGR